MSGGVLPLGRRLALPLTAAALLLASGCGSGDSAGEAEPATEVAANQTVLGLLRDEDTLTGTAELVDRAGLSQTLDAAPSYTLLAPTDAALGALAPGGAVDADVPAIAALLRGHLLPGYVTLDDIKAAITASEGNSVTMQTMAQTPVTFTVEGDQVTVSAPDGSSAALTGADLRGGNGVILPLDGVLKAL